MSSSAPSQTPPPASINWLPEKSSLHFVAGGLGGMCGAIVTSPFDVVKTRLQSDLFRAKHANYGVAGLAEGSSGSAVLLPRRPARLLYNFVETGHILRDIYLHESPRALFKGLGPTLVGVVPARSINFFAYGNGKQIIAKKFNDGQENAYVHVCAAAIAGILTGTATNPIWVVKTRMQLSASEQLKRQAPEYFHSNGKTPSFATGSWVTIKQIFREEGVRGFYKGLSASYLGVTEGTIQWTLYERLKAKTKGRGGLTEWAGMVGSAGVAKSVAAVCTYPHEVIRTRLRQPKVNGVVKYTGLWQTLRLVLAEEGVHSLYGGLSAHLMRVVPNSAVMFVIYEGIIRWGAR